MRSRCDSLPWVCRGKAKRRCCVSQACRTSTLPPLSPLSPNTIGTVRPDERERVSSQRFLLFAHGLQCLPHEHFASIVSAISKHDRYRSSARSWARVCGYGSGLVLGFRCRFRVQVRPCFSFVFGRVLPCTHGVQCILHEHFASIVSAISKHDR